MRTPSIRRVFLLASALCAALFAGTAIAQPAAFDNKRLASGADSSGPPHVKVFNGLTFSPLHDFNAYDGGFSGGVRVALGDVNGDGIVDLVTGAGAGVPGGHVKVFDGRTGAEIRSFLAFPGFAGGVHVAAGDVNGDGFADIIVGAGAAAPPFLRVFDGRTGTMPVDIDAFATGFAGGVRVAAGDVNSDGFDDIIVGAGAATGASPHVKAFDGRNMGILHDFNAYAAGFAGGVYVAAGDIDGDGRADIITGAGAGAGGHVKAFSGANLAELRSFLAYDLSFTGGVRVGAGDVNGDGFDDIITGVGPGAAPSLKVYPGPAHAAPSTFNAYAAGFTGGIFVAGPVLNNTLLRDGFE